MTCVRELLSVFTGEPDRATRLRRPALGVSWRLSEIRDVDGESETPNKNQCEGELSCIRKWKCYVAP
jgi:hypothetical protein